MKRILSIVFLVSAFSLACGGEENDSDSTRDRSSRQPGPTRESGPGAPEEAPDETVVNGKPATEYYGQFIYEKDDIRLSGAGTYARQPNDDNVFLAQFYLLENKSFEFYYAEGFGEVSGTGFSVNSRQDRKWKITGRWSIKDGELIVGDVASCTGSRHNELDVLRCTLNRAIGYQVAVGRSWTASAIKGTSLDDSDLADYAPAK